MASYIKKYQKEQGQIIVMKGKCATTWVSLIFYADFPQIWSKIAEKPGQRYDVTLAEIREKGVNFGIGIGIAGGTHDRHNRL